MIIFLLLIGNLKITPLQERRSISRGLRVNSVSRVEENLKPQSSLKIKQENKPELIRIDPRLNESMEVGEEEQLKTYALFTKIISGTLDRLGGD